jgi:hypothetical protein
MNSTKLDPRLQKLVDMGESGTDILHGELKNLMLDAERGLLNVSELQDYPTHRYISGYLDALTEVYGLTYNLAFAISDRSKARG